MSVRPHRSVGLSGMVRVAVVFATLAVGSLMAWGEPPASATVTVTSHFIQTATSSNLIGGGFITEINNAATNGNPNAVLFVTPVFNSGGVCGCVAFSDPVAVYYASGDQKWGIADATISNNIPVGAQFNVMVVQKPSNSVFTATASASNISGNGFTLNQKSTVGKGTALLQVTQNYTPGGRQVSSVNAHAPGLVYGLGPKGKDWDIQNLDNASMPIGAAYNVMVGSGSSNEAKPSCSPATPPTRSGSPRSSRTTRPPATPTRWCSRPRASTPTGSSVPTSPTRPAWVTPTARPTRDTWLLDGTSMPTTTHYFNLLIFGS